MNLEYIYNKYKKCTKCPLYLQGRTQVVMGEGNPSSSIMFVGEGPGADEDRSGRPFVGKAGQLLNKILEAVGILRDEIYISNIVKCRPPGNRTPTDEEMFRCIDILREQFIVIKPKIIVTLGSASTRALIDPKAKISKMRGMWIEKKGIKFMATYHPAYLLRNPSSKKEVWIDFQKIYELYKGVKK